MKCLDRAFGGVEEIGLSIITPTAWLPGHRMEKLRDEIVPQLAANDRWYIVGDGDVGPAGLMVQGISDDRVTYRSEARTNICGNYQRDAAMRRAEGDFLIFYDDTTMVPRNALEKIRCGIFQHPWAPHIFCFVLPRKNPPMRGRALPRSRGLRARPEDGPLCGSMMVVPNDMEAVGSWIRPHDGLNGDERFLNQTLAIWEGRCVFHNEAIGVYLGNAGEEPQVSAAWQEVISG